MKTQTDDQAMERLMNRIAQREIQAKSEPKPAPVKVAHKRVTGRLVPIGCRSTQKLFDSTFLSSNRPADLDCR